MQNQSSLSPGMLYTPKRSALDDVSHDLFATPRSAIAKRLPFQLLHNSSLVQNSLVTRKNKHTLLYMLMFSKFMSSIPLLLQVECADDELSDAEKVYAECGQRCPLPWEECILPQRMKRCVKIGEGTFGEVFAVPNASGETVALKVCMLTCSRPVMPSVLWFLI